MNGFAIALAIVAATNFMLPPTTESSNRESHRQQAKIDGTRLNGVIYYDAPISSIPTLRR